MALYLDLPCRDHLVLRCCTVSAAAVLDTLVGVAVGDEVGRLAKERARLKKQEAEGRMQPDADIVKRLRDMFSLQVK